MQEVTATLNSASLVKNHVNYNAWAMQRSEQMTSTDIINYRLVNQQIAETKFTKPQEIVAWMGAMQAQEYAMAKWAIGVRLPHATDQTIEQAIDDAKIIRTHILRPTWHFVSADDIRWMLQLTAPHIYRASGSMFRKLELTDAVITKSNKVIEKALEGKQLTRQEIMKALEEAGIATNDLRGVHLMFKAELDGVVCNGARRGKQFTYALLDERVPQSKALTREEALAELAKRYFTSHGPATLRDYVWWSGLPVADARAGLASIKTMLTCEKVGAQEFWYDHTSILKNDFIHSVYVLPAFDEYMVSYKDRSAALSTLYSNQVFTMNGIFKPIIVVNGKVIGIWKRTIKKDSLLVETLFFSPAEKIEAEILYHAIEPYAQFLGLKTEIVT